MGEAAETLRQLGVQRAAFLQRLTDVLAADPRVEGAWLAGSDGRGEADEWSDFDLNVAVRDTEVGLYLQERPLLYRVLGEPILVQQDMRSNNLNLGDAIYQLVYFEGGVMVDWNVGPASQARKPIGHLLLFERRPFEVVSLPPLTNQERREHLQKWTTFFWAMAPIAVKYAARGSTRQAASQTDLLARAIICLKRLLSESDSANPWLTWTNRPLEDKIDGALPRAGLTITPESVLEVISRQCELVSKLHPALIALDVDVHPRMEATTAELITIASAVIQMGDFSERRYR